MTEAFNRKWPTVRPSVLMLVPILIFEGDVIFLYLLWFRCSTRLTSHHFHFDWIWFSSMCVRNAHPSAFHASSISFRLIALGTCVVDFAVILSSHSYLFRSLVSRPFFFLLLLFGENNFQVDGHTHAVRSHSAIPTNSICYCETLNNIYLTNRHTNNSTSSSILYCCFILVFFCDFFRCEDDGKRQRGRVEKRDSKLLARRISWFENLFLGIDTVNQPLNHRNVLTLYRYTHTRCPHEHKSNRRTTAAAPALVASAKWRKQKTFLYHFQFIKH